MPAFKPCPGFIWNWNHDVWKDGICDHPEVLLSTMFRCVFSPNLLLDLVLKPCCKISLVCMLILLPWHAVNIKFDCVYTHEEMLRCQTWVLLAPCCAFRTFCLLASYLQLFNEICVHIILYKDRVDDCVGKRYLWLSKVKHMSSMYFARGAKWVCQVGQHPLDV